MKYLVLVTALMFPLAGFAHGNRAEFTGSAVLEATKVFAKNNAAQVKNFKGVVAEIASATTAKVEVYLLDNTKAVTYTCTHMDHNGQMMITCK